MNHLAQKLEIVPTIPGLSLAEVIGRGASSLVYRGVLNDRPVAVKIYQPNSQNPADKRAFFREAALLARIKSSGAAKVLASGEMDGRPFIVLQLLNGPTLEKLIRQNKLKEDEILLMAQTISIFLSELHGYGFVHRDIKPANIVWDKIVGPVLIDLGLATTTSHLKDTNLIAGSLAYCSPEQLGVIKTPLDGRSDLYNLGAVLYECFVGHPPFHGLSLTELLRAHATTQPAPLSKKIKIDPAIEQIILRLLKKDPDDRFASADDLLSHIHSIVPPSTQDNFPPISITHRRRGRIRSPLFGRETERSTLEKEWSMARSGQVRAVAIEGASGMGKSRLISDFIGDREDGEALVMAGKCELNSPLPFAVLRSAVDSVIKSLAKPDQGDLKEKIQNSLERSLGNLRFALQSFSPEMKSLLGRENLPSQPVEGEEQFLNLVSDLLLSFSDTGRPLILFIDDIQWIDQSSLKVLRKLAAQAGQRRILFLLAARPRQQGYVTSEDIKNAIHLPITEIELSPLSPSASADIVRFILGDFTCAPEILDYIVGQTGGNPFAIQAYTSAVIDEGALRLEEQGWQLNHDVMAQLSLPSDILHLLTNRIDHLPEETKKVLFAAAVLGSRFDSFLLGQVTRLDAAEVHTALFQAVQAHLIEPRDAPTLFHFVHDKIQEALLSDCSESVKQDYHALAAAALSDLQPTDPDQIFLMARHYRLGKPEEDPRRAFEANLMAGNLAIETRAYADAYEFLKTAEVLESKFSNKARIEIKEKLGTICYRLFRLEEAISYLNVCIEKEDDPIRRSELHALKVGIYVAGFHFEEAWTALGFAYRSLGVPPPSNRFSLWFKTLFQFLVSIFFRQLLLKFPFRNEKRRAHAMALSALGKITTVITFYQLEHFLFFQSAMLHLFNGLRLGPGEAAARAHLPPGSVFRIMKLTRLGNRFYAQVHAMTRALNNPEIAAEIHAYDAVSQCIGGTSLNAEPLLVDVLDKFERWLTVEDSVNVTGVLCWALLMRGDVKSAITRSSHINEKLNEVGSSIDTVKHYRIWQESFLMAAYARLGEKTKSVESMLYCKEVGVDQHPYNLGMHLGYVLQARFEQQRFDEPITDIVSKFDSFGIPPILCPMNLRHYYVMKSYYLLYGALTAAPSAAQMQEIQRSLKDLRWTSDRPILKAHLNCCLGIQAEIKGQLDRALKLLGKAEGEAAQAEGIWVEFEVNYAKARIYRRKGLTQTAFFHALFAYALAIKQEWIMWAQRIESEFSLNQTQLNSISRSVSLTVHNVPATNQVRAEAQLSALLRVSLILTATTEPKEFGRRALDEVIAILGAERGILFLLGADDELRTCASRAAGRIELEDARGYSSSILERVRLNRKTMIITGTAQGEEIGSESIVAHDLRSIIAAPLVANERLLGVIYLDTRLASNMFGPEDSAILEALGSQVAASFEIANATRLEVEKATLRKDLEVGSMVQSMFLPHQTELQRSGFALKGFYRPSALCGGDWWKILEATDERLSVLLADVTGHGSGPAMITASAASGLNTLIALAGKDVSPVSIMQELNRLLLEQFSGQYLMTATIAEYNVATRKLTVYSAAAPFLVISTNGGTIKTLGGGGQPLGLNDHQTCSIETLEVDHGDRVHIFTDGLPETVSEGRQIGFKRLAQHMQSTHGTDLGIAVGGIVSRIDQFRGGGVQEDDYTLVSFDAK